VTGHRQIFVTTSTDIATNFPDESLKEWLSKAIK
jgi:transposase